MPAQTVAMRRSAQPQYACGVDWSNPITRGLKFAFNPAMGFINLVNGDRPLNQNAAFATTVGLSGVRLDGAAATYAEFLPRGLETAGNSLTIVSMWTAKAGQYANIDGFRGIIGTRTAGNAGWSYGRSGAAAGGTFGNVTFQSYILQGVAQYIETNSLIESMRDRTVCCRVNGTTASWFMDGIKTSADTTIGTATTGGNLVVGTQGPYSAPAQTWLDRAYCVFAWNRPLADSEIVQIGANPWQLFSPRLI